MPLSPEKLSNMLVAAVLKNDAGGIGSVISMGADVNRSDAKGNVPLTIAATDPREQTGLKALLEAKANPNVPGANGKLPLHSVLRMKEEKLLLPPLEILLAAKADPNLIERIPGQAPLNALQVAIVASRSDKVLERLLRAGADPALGEDGSIGLSSPLHALAHMGRYAALEAAYLAGANLNKPDFEGRTALMLAARAGALRTSEALLEWGADPTLKDKQGQDAMAHARTAPPDADMRSLIKAMMVAANDRSLRKELQDLRAEFDILRQAVLAKLGS